MKQDYSMDYIIFSVIVMFLFLVLIAIALFCD
jgi:hypothetical protein